MPRILLGGGFLSLPAFFVGVIFVALWSKSSRKDLALGSNLFGSLLGGLASMLTMVTGVYAGALLLVRREAG